jgi:hypothetical protein
VTSRVSAFFKSKESVAANSAVTHVTPPFASPSRFATLNVPLVKDSLNAKAVQGSKTVQQVAITHTSCRSQTQAGAAASSAEQTKSHKPHACATLKVTDTEQPHTPPLLLSSALALPSASVSAASSTHSPSDSV